VSPADLQINYNLWSIGWGYFQNHKQIIASPCST
jgi:hypothetical protein